METLLDKLTDNLELIVDTKHVQMSLKTTKQQIKTRGQLLSQLTLEYIVKCVIHFRFDTFLSTR